MSVELVSINGISMKPQQGENAPPNVETNDQDSSGSRCKCCRGPYSLWMSFCRWYICLLERIFAFIGQVIASRPWITILICLLMVGICSVGFVRFKVENRTEKLFIPQDSQAIKDLNEAEKYFRMKVREETVLLEASSEANILAPKCIREALNIHREIMKLDSYIDLCATASGKKSNSSKSCLFVNPLEIFSFKEENLVNISLQIMKTYNNTGWRMRNGRPLVYNFARLFGGVTKNASTGKMHVNAIQMIYFMQDAKDDSEFDDINKFEEKFIKKISSLADEISCGKLYYSTERSLDDAISESSGSDIGLVSITFTLMISLACTFLGKFRNPLTGHSLLANTGVFAVALGILAGFGLSMFAGAPFVSLVGVLPFLVIGIGIDDMFIILDELDRHKPQDVVETVKVVMSNSGATITMTTLTDLVAFAVSTSTPFPAIRYFCMYAALSLTCAYLMIVTYFIAIMTFDIRRIKSGRRDCLPFCLAPLPKEGEPAWDEPQPQVSNRAMQAWATFLMLPGTKVAVIIVSLGLLGAGIYGATQIDERFDRRLLAKDDSYLIKFLDTQEKYFDLSIAVSIVMTGKIKFEDSATQDQIKKLSDIVKENKHYHNRALSWFNTFMNFAKEKKINITSKGQFMYALKTFLNIPRYSFFHEDVKLSEDEQHIEASRIIVSMKNSTSSTFQRDAMLTLRKDISSKSALPVFPITKEFIFFEQYAIILSATIQNLAIAAVAILLLTSPFLVDFAVILLVSLGFVALIFELFGLMYIWGVSLNSISMINLVMAIGFAVDYSAHVAHAFLMSQKRTANERVIEALSTLGASVFMGGLSTFIGMVVTAFAASEIFRIFFRMFFGIVVFGLLHGLCFLPVYLSLIFWQPRISLVSRVSDVNEHEQDAAPKEDEGIALETRREMKETLPVEDSEANTTFQPDLSQDTKDGEVEGKLPGQDGKENGGFESDLDQDLRDANTREHSKITEKKNCQEQQADE